LIDSEMALSQFRQEAAVECLGVRQQEHRKALQVRAKLIAQNIRGIGEFGSYL